MDENGSRNREYSRQSERRREREKRRRRKKIRNWTIIIFVAVILSCSLFLFMRSLMATPPAEPTLTGEVVSVTIPEGSSTADIADILKENDLIGNAFMFRLKSRLDGYDGSYQQGTYDIDKGLTVAEIMELLQTGVVYNEVRFTVPEGYNTNQIAARAEELGVCTAEEFINECNTGTFDYPFLADLPERENRLEGYLFPDTYYIREETTAHQLITAMLNRFSQMYTEEYQAAVAASEYTLDELVTMASIIEKEIALDEERPRAAGVIYNRLAAGMPLQMDATVLYAMGIVKENISTVDLQFDSPYNTYKVAGLPIGPIANPGELSFRAALYPEDNDYIYYVVEAKGQRNHLYFANYDDFLKAKANYQASGE